MTGITTGQDHDPISVRHIYNLGIVCPRPLSLKAHP
jgi:hypothetical protein